MLSERIKNMAESALLGHDLFPAVVEEKVKSDEDLKKPVEIGQGIYRYLEKQPVEVFENEFIVGRNRFVGCEYPADYYRSNGHRNNNKYWGALCYRHPTDIFYWG